jgi:putative oxidoreductase
VQRLFSTFPNSWPGAGLLILRCAAVYALFGVDFASSGFGDVATMLLGFVVFGIAGFLILGFGTPFAAIGQAVSQVGVLVQDQRYDSSLVVATALGLALAMLGPGAWSLDAMVFGRKRIV